MAGEEGVAWESSEALSDSTWRVVESALTDVISYIQMTPLDHPDRVHLESLSRVRNLAKRSEHEINHKENQ